MGRRVPIRKKTDENKLKKLGLLRLREQVNPGHGVVQIVEPVAEKFEMRIAL